MARILENEIAGDPTNQNYAAMNDIQLLASLNTKNRTRNRTSMSRREIADIIPFGLYTALSDVKKSHLLSFLAESYGRGANKDLNPFGFTEVVFKDVFGSASTAITALNTARVENLSRGEEIGWGVVKEKDLRMHTITRAHPQE